jgi:tRNA 2-selenouridine synthase SelU
MSIRVKTRLENQQLIVTLIHQPTQKAFEFAGDVDMVEKMAKDLVESCRLARQKLGLPALILPFGAKTN